MKPVEGAGLMPGTRSRALTLDRRDELPCDRGRLAEGVQRSHVGDRKRAAVPGGEERQVVRLRAEVVGGHAGNMLSAGTQDESGAWNRDGRRPTMRDCGHAVTTGCACLENRRSAASLSGLNGQVDFEDWTDAQLLEAIQGPRDADARGALAALFERHAPAVRGLLAHLGGADEARREDWVHDTFLTAMRLASTFRAGSARPWLLTIAARHVRATCATRAARTAVVAPARLTLRPSARMPRPARG